jgi:hypothetical protein
MQCQRCQTAIEENDIKTELPCHHFFHTTCFMNLLVHQHENGYYVCECGAHILAHEDEDEEVAEAEIQQTEVNHQVAERLRIRTLYETNQNFKKTIENFKKKASEVKRKYTALKKLTKEKKQEIQTQLSTIKTQLEGLTELKKSEIQESQIYKDFLKSKRAYTLLHTRLETTYNCRAIDIWRSLYDKRGFQRYIGVSRWRYSHYGILTRPWSYRVP